MSSVNSEGILGELKRSLAVSQKLCNSGVIQINCD